MWNVVNAGLDFQVVQVKKRTKISAWILNLDEDYCIYWSKFSSNTESREENFHLKFLELK